MVIPIYGIWSIAKKMVIFIRLSLEETETEYDLEGYTEDTHVIVCLHAAYDVSSLER